MPLDTHRYWSVCVVILWGCKETTPFFRKYHEWSMWVICLFFEYRNCEVICSDPPFKPFRISLLNICYAYLRYQTQRLKYSQQTTQQLTHSEVSAMYTHIELLGVRLFSYSAHLIYIPWPPPLPPTHRRESHGYVTLLTYLGDEWSWNI